LEATTPLLWFRASRPGQYIGILVPRHFLKIEQTLGHGILSLVINHPSILGQLLADTVPFVTTLFIDLTVYLYRVYAILFPSRSSDNHYLGRLINILDVVFPFLSATLFSSASLSS